MLPHHSMVEFLAREHELELRKYFRRTSAPAPRRAGWLVGALVLVLTGASFLVR